MTTVKKSAQSNAYLALPRTAPSQQPPSTQPLNSYSDFNALCQSTVTNKGNNLLGSTVHFLASSNVLVEHGMTRPKCYTANIVSVVRAECTGAQNTGISVNLTWTDDKGKKQTETGIIYQGFSSNNSDSDPWTYPNFHNAAHNPQLYPTPGWILSPYPPGTILEDNRGHFVADGPPSATYTGCAGVTDASVSDGATTWICWCKGKETYRAVTPLGQTLDGAAITAAHGACQDQVTGDNSFLVVPDSTFTYTARVGFADYYGTSGPTAGVRANIKIIDVTPNAGQFSPIAYGKNVTQYVKMTVGSTESSLLGPLFDLGEVVIGIVHVYNPGGSVGPEGPGGLSTGPTGKYLAWWFKELRHQLTGADRPLISILLGKVLLPPNALNTVHNLAITRGITDQDQGSSLNFVFYYDQKIVGKWNTTNQDYRYHPYVEVGIEDHSGALTVIPTHTYNDMQKVFGKAIDPDTGALSWQFEPFSGRDYINTNHRVLSGTWVNDFTGTVTYSPFLFP